MEKKQPASIRNQRRPNKILWDNQALGVGIFKINDILK